MRALIAAVLVALAVAGAAEAKQPPLSATDKQILSQLSPKNRQEVLSRLGPGQAVREIVETMALNKLSAAYVEGRIVEIDVIKGVAVVQYKDGTRKVVEFKVDEVVIAE